MGPVIGDGRFTLIKTSPSGEPYRGTVPIFTGGVAEDLAYYFMFSEQIPTACGIGERIESGKVTASGGYFVQSLPNTCLCEHCSQSASGAAHDSLFQYRF